MLEQQQANHSSDLKVALSRKSLVSVTFSPGSAVQTRVMDKGSFNLALKLLIFDMLYEYSKRPLIVSPKRTKLWWISKIFLFGLFWSLSTPLVTDHLIQLKVNLPEFPFDKWCKTALGSLPEFLVAMSVIGVDVKLLPVARMHTLWVSGSFPAWHISLCNAIGSAEGVDIIPKLSHPVSMPTTLQTRYLKLEFSTTKLAKEKKN